MRIQDFLEKKRLIHSLRKTTLVALIVPMIIMSISVFSFLLVIILNSVILFFITAVMCIGSLMIFHLKYVQAKYMPIRFANKISKANGMVEKLLSDTQSEKISKTMNLFNRDIYIHVNNLSDIHLNLEPNTLNLYIFTESSESLDNLSDIRVYSEHKVYYRMTYDNKEKKYNLNDALLYNHNIVTKVIKQILKG